MYKILIALSLLLISYSSFALSKLGHQLVCQLAYEQLSTSKQARINEVLQSMTKADVKLINGYNHDKKTAEITFAKACTWPDAIKKTSKYDQYKPWHYINVARNETSVTPQDCPKGCLTDAILFHYNQLTVASNQQDKIQALMFLGHWLGDIHQPLHVSYFDDLGGNKRKVYSKKSQCTNLHWLWDDCLLNADKSYKGNKQQVLDEMVGKLINQWPAEQEDSSLNSALTQDVYQWASESLILIRTESFLYCQLDSQGSCNKMTEKVVEIPNSYFSEYQPVLEQRILQAAVRLNRLLNNAL